MTNIRCALRALLQGTRIPALLLCLCFQSEGLYAQIAVVVNAKNPTDSLRIAQLTRIYLCQVTYWDFGDGRKEPVTLIDYRGHTKTVKEFYGTVTGLSQAKVRLAWMGKMLNGELQSLPVKLSSAQEVLSYVAKTPGAVAFIEVEKLDLDVHPIKIVKIDGKGIKNKAYPLK